MNINKKEVIIGIGVVFVAGVLFYLFQLEGLKHITNAIKRPKIEIRSTNRPHSNQIVTGEILRFALKNAKSETVFWLFDEKKVEKGGIETDYLFKFDQSRPTGGESTHRVDAFFRDGNDYRAVCKKVNVTNLNVLAYFNAIEKTLKLKVSPALASGLQLKSLSLAYYNEGRFSSIEQIPIDSKDMVVTADNEGLTKAIDLYLKSAVLKAMLKYMKGYPNEWAMLNFSDIKNNEKLTLAQPLALVKKGEASNKRVE